MLIIKEMLENELLLKQILEQETVSSMLRFMIAESSCVDTKDLEAKIEHQKRVTKKAISEYIKQHKEGLLADLKAVKDLEYGFNSVKIMECINSLEKNTSYLETNVIKPYEQLSNDIKVYKQKADEVKLLGLLEELSTYYEYGSDFDDITDPYILGK